MINHLVNKRTEILAVVTFQHSPFMQLINHFFALLISMLRFNSISFYRTRSKIKLFLQTQKFRALGGVTPPPIADFWLSACF